MSVRILVVDDAPEIRDLLSLMFMRQGWNVVGVAADGEEAIALYAALRPDVVTMDIVMGDRDGISAMKAILNDDPRARVVICSTVSSRHMVLEALRSGAKDFIIKPFLKQTVISTIERIVGTLEVCAS